MSIFENIKKYVTARDVARRYNLAFNEHGMAICPFHPDHNPSMKLDERFHCFGCGKDGDAIDLAAGLLGMDLMNAAKKLMMDFGLETKEQKKTNDKSPPGSQTPKGTERNISSFKKVDGHRISVTGIEQAVEQWILFAEKILLQYIKILERLRLIYAPRSLSEDFSEKFCEILEQRFRYNCMLDILMFGTKEEQIDLLIRNGKEVDLLAKQMERFNG